MNSRNSNTRAVITKKTIDSAQPHPLDSLKPSRVNRSCQRKSTHDTAVYRKSSTQLLLGRGSVRAGDASTGPDSSWAGGRPTVSSNARWHRVVPAGVEGVTAQQPTHR